MLKHNHIIELLLYELEHDRGSHVFLVSSNQLQIGLLYTSWLQDSTFIIQIVNLFFFGFVLCVVLVYFLYPFSVLVTWTHNLPLFASAKMPSLFRFKFYHLIICIISQLSVCSSSPMSVLYNFLILQ